MTLGKLANGTLVFVPGIMGSELRLRGVDDKGMPRDQLVWGEDIGTVMKTLGREPEVLGSADLVSTTVIRHMRYHFLKLVKVYGPLIDFCCDKKGLDLTPNKNFQPFAYDWRLDLLETANLLDQFIEKTPGPVFILAHSMGGLVTRIMLNMNGAGSRKVAEVFQIASPVEGSTKAFTTIKRHPSLSSLADPLWKLYHNFKPDRRAKLTEVMANMPSLYQLMPPDRCKILLKRSGTKLSAVDSSMWLARDMTLVNKAQLAHQLLQLRPKVPIKGIFSVDLDTDWLVGVNDQRQLLGTQSVADGDGTVVTSSANALSTTVKGIKGKQAEHTSLCSMKCVHDELRSFLS